MSYQGVNTKTENLRQDDTGEPREPSTGNGEEELVFYKNKGWKSSVLYTQHVKYCKRLIFFSLATELEDFDTQRINLLHFLIATLDVLGVLNRFSCQEQERIITWIYSLQICGHGSDAAGFVGSRTLKCMDLFGAQTTGEELRRRGEQGSGHLTMTFASLVCLLSLRDDLQRVNRSEILEAIQKLQNKDGSFRASTDCPENDMRFVYSAVAICFILNDFSRINIPKLQEYIKNSFTYEGSFSASAGSTHSHAAFAFCAIASLCLVNKLEDTLTDTQIECLARWCLFRQLDGFQGRPNKDQDTCYSFWVGATLAMLGKQYAGRTENIEWILSNQNPLTGGIGKCDNDLCDPLHTFMGLAGLSLVSYDKLMPIIPELTMTKEALNHLRRLHEMWQLQDKLSIF